MNVAAAEAAVNLGVKGVMAAAVLVALDVYLVLVAVP